MNLIQEVREGIKGNRKGLQFYMNKLNEALGGIHPFYYVFAGESKSGKTSMVDLNFLLGPYLAGESFECHYWSTEITRIEKEARVVSALAFIKYSQTINSELILGRKMGPDGKPLKLTREQYALVKKIYYEDIITLFGEFDLSGRQTKPGLVYFYEDRKTPMEIRNRAWLVAQKHGTIQTYEIETIQNGVPVKVKEFQNYIPHDPNKRIILILDHIRGLKGLEGQKKYVVDKMSEEFVDLRRYFKFTICCIVHFNRDGGSLDGFKGNREHFYPNHDSLKDSGNLAEDANYIVTMFDPNDIKYGLVKHMKRNLADYDGKLRTLHIVRGRNAKAPMHIPVIFHGEEGVFQDLSQYVNYGKG